MRALLLCRSILAASFLVIKSIGAMVSVEGGEYLLEFERNYFHFVEELHGVDDLRQVLTVLYGVAQVRVTSCVLKKDRNIWPMISLVLLKLPRTTRHIGPVFQSSASRLHIYICTALFFTTNIQALSVKHELHEHTTQH